MLPRASIAYWPGERKKLGPRIVFGTAAGSLIALDAKTGKPSAGFGTDGIIDFKEGVANGFKTQVGMSSPPSIYKNVIITGVRVQEQPALGPAGDTRGWDVVKRASWLSDVSLRFRAQGEQGIETWETPDSWKNRSGTNAWGFLSVDQETGTVFVPLSAATTDEYGGDRKVQNLYSQTLVALDALTGKQKWHFQAIHHDTWDFDFGSAPILRGECSPRGSETIPVVVQTNKTGLVWILDRRDGTPVLWCGRARPIPASDVPGEDSWNTEPFPLKPAPLSRMSFKKEELANVTPEHTRRHARISSQSTPAPITMDRSRALWSEADQSSSRYVMRRLPNYQGGTYDPKA